MFFTNLKRANQHLYKPCGFVINNEIVDNESQEYAAGTYGLNGLKIMTRTAKITPKKVGQFVAIWQRDDDGITQPQHVDGDFDLMVINCMKGDKFGQFVFPKAVLVKKHIVSTSTKRGKNGIRVYPAWDVATNKQAVKTQAWQLNHFLEIGEDTDIELAKRLYLSA